MIEGFRVLLVEDEFMLAQELRRELERAGVIVVGPEPSVERAMVRLDEGGRIDAAILDVNVGGVRVFPVSDSLAARNIPFLFCTGYEDEVVRARFPAVITCPKPINMRNLLEKLQGLLHKSTAVLP